MQVNEDCAGYMGLKSKGVEVCLGILKFIFNHQQ